MSLEFSFGIKRLLIKKAKRHILIIIGSDLYKAIQITSKHVSVHPRTCSTIRPMYGAKVWWKSQKHVETMRGKCTSTTWLRKSWTSLPCAMALSQSTRPWRESETPQWAEELFLSLPVRVCVCYSFILLLCSSASYSAFCFHIKVPVPVVSLGLQVKENQI